MLPISFAMAEKIPFAMALGSRGSSQGKWREIHGGMAWKSPVYVHLPLWHSLRKPALCTGAAMKILGKETQEEREEDKGP